MLVGLFFFACDDDMELKTRSYPAINTKEVTEISPNEARLHAEILSIGNAGISDHGFVYDDEPNPNLDKSDRISLGEASQKGTFSALVSGNLIKDKRYFVKAYAITKDNSFIVYGWTVEFVGR